jgi:hypothetical protein
LFRVRGCEQVTVYCVFVMGLEWSDVVIQLSKCYLQSGLLTHYLNNIQIRFISYREQSGLPPYGGNPTTSDSCSVIDS